MKTFSIAFALLFSAFLIKAQGTTEATTDTTEIVVGNRVISVTKDAENGRNVTIRSKDGEGNDQEWAMGNDDDADNGRIVLTRGHNKKKNVDVDLLAIDLGMNFLTQDFDFNLPTELGALETRPWGSTHLGLHLLKTKVNLIKHKVNLITGITLDNNRYAFRNSTILLPGQDNLTAIIDSIEYRKSKLITWHAQIPLLLNFQTNPDRASRNFHFSVGGFAGLLMGGITKRKADDLGKIRQNDDYNLNNVRYGAMARIGYGGFEVYANYNLSSMFREDQGPEIHPFTFGVSLTGAM